MDMNFRDWVISEQLSPEEAITVMGLEGIFSKEQLEERYRRLALQMHPDRNPSPNAHEEFKKLQAAYETLTPYIGQDATKATIVQSQQDQPKPRKRYTEQDVENLAKWVVDNNYYKFIFRQMAERLPWTFSGNFERETIGAKEWEKSLNKINYFSVEKIVELIGRAIQQDGAKYPDFIVGIGTNENWKEAWVTYQCPLPNVDVRAMFGWKNQYGWRTLSFKPGSAPKKKGVGMKKEDVRSQLLQAGLRSLPHGGSGDYFGDELNIDGRTISGYMIKLQPRAFVLVSRSRLDRGYKKEMHEFKIKSLPYGKLTPQVVDNAINWFRSKRK
jgi:hypothetical protein